jgi:aldehyde dehydrogenase
MSNPSPTQTRASSFPTPIGAIGQSTSFAAHVRGLERTIPLRARYENFIGGQWVAPAKGGYFHNVSPTTGQVICEIARSQAQDVEVALDAAQAAAASWGRTAVAARARALNLIADRIEQYLPFLAAVETYDNGKPIRETNLADLPLAVDHFRYFASCVRAQEGSVGELDDDTVAYHFHEPLGVVAQIIPWNFPLLMAAWKLAPALAAGNVVVLKPAEQTPLSILVFAELIQDLLPPGVLNIVNGFGIEAGKPLARVPGSTRWPSRVRPRPGGSSCSTPPKTSSR